MTSVPRFFPNNGLGGSLAILPPTRASSDRLLFFGDHGGDLVGECGKTAFNFGDDYVDAYVVREGLSDAVAVGGEEDHFCTRQELLDQAGRFDSAKAGHDYVEDHEIRLMLACTLNRRDPVVSFCADFDLREFINEGANDSAHGRIVVRDQDTYRFLFGHGSVTAISAAARGVR